MTWKLNCPSVVSLTSCYLCVMLACSRRENGSGVCLDLQAIDNVPGAKVEEDTETHHVLAGNLYKPRRRVTHTQ